MPTTFMPTTFFYTLIILTILTGVIYIGYLIYSYFKSPAQYKHKLPWWISYSRNIFPATALLVAVIHYWGDFPLILTLLTATTGIIYIYYSCYLFFTHTNRHASPWWFNYSKTLFPGILIVLLIRSFLFESFQIPSGSMYPTLKIGDFIVVNKYIYGLRYPIGNKSFLNIETPQRGDVIVFRYPQDKKINFIKRVIGLPGDKIVYTDKQLFINDKLVATRFIRNVVPTKFLDKDKKLEYVEVLDNVMHNIYLKEGYNWNSGAGEWIVPQGNYFVMGDNRDNSHDSRYWKYVPAELLVGKATYVWMNWTSGFSTLPSFTDNKEIH